MEFLKINGRRISYRSCSCTYDINGQDTTPLALRESKHSMSAMPVEKEVVESASNKEPSPLLSMSYLTQKKAQSDEVEVKPGCQYGP